MSELDKRARLIQQSQKWLEQKKMHDELSSMGVNEQVFQDNKGKLLTEITYKLTEKFKAEMKKGDDTDIKIEKAISKEIESNTCPVCFELMLPPKHSPMLLFPCGHSFCKECITTHSEKNRDKCPMCRNKIQSKAINLSLQSLICTHTNNKHLLDKYNEEVEQEEKKQSLKAANKQEEKKLEQYQKEFEIFEMRYRIVKQEKVETEKELKNHEKNLQVQEKVIKELEKNKSDVLKKMEALKKELELIDDFISNSERDQEKMLQGIEESKMKLELIEGTLKPIQTEKEKYELIIKSLSQ